MESMEQSTIILYAMVVLVLIGIPVILAKKSGKSPMEMLFGKRRSNGLLGTRKKKSTKPIINIQTAVKR